MLTVLTTQVWVLLIHLVTDYNHMTCLSKCHEGSNIHEKEKKVEQRQISFLAFHPFDPT